MRQPRLAEMVANALRDRILAGQMDVLPPQEELLATYAVSRPSLREALSILEIEGLITVRRGRQGGADVHPPSRDSVAYMLSLLLQSQRASLSDVGVALRQMEPVCAGLCARRNDRAKVVVPRLAGLQEEMRARIDDPIGFVNSARGFHEALVELCGNRTLIELVGVLERLWSAHEQQWAARAASSGDFPSVQENRTSGLRAHDKIIGLIRQGEADGVVQLSRLHLERTQIWALGTERGQPIRARLLRR